jgi:hypothetical protein
LGKNIYGAVEHMNKIESTIYNLWNSKTRAGLSIAAGVVAKTLGFNKLALTGAAIPVALGGSSVARQVSNLYNLPIARKLALNSIKELVSGNTAKGQRTLLNLAKLADSQSKKSKK